MQPFFNPTQAVFATTNIADEVAQLELTAAFSSLHEPAANTLVIWQDQGTGTYPLTTNRGATDNTKIAVGQGTGEMSHVDRIEFDPNSVDVGLHEDLVSGHLYYGAVDLQTTGSGDVVGPAGAADNAIARYDGVTGKLIQNSVVLVSDTGDITGVATVNGNPVPVGFGDVVGPGAATDNALTRYDGATGKLVQNSGVTLDDTQNMAGLNGITFVPTFATFQPFLSWDYRSGTVTTAGRKSGPWLAKPDLPWLIERVGNTVTMSIGPAFALNDGVAAVISYDFGDFPILGLAGFIPAAGAANAQHGITRVINGGTGQMVEWRISGGGGFVLSFTNGPIGSPYVADTPFTGGSTGDTGFPNTTTLSWVLTT